MCAVMRDVGVILLFLYMENGDRKRVVQAVTASQYTLCCFTVAELYIQFCVFAEKQNHAAEIPIFRGEPVRISGAS